MLRITLSLLAISAVSSSFALTLGSFNFDATKMGDTLTESDGGVHSSTNWLNTSPSNPGNPGFLTGASFDTGIANIGFFGDSPKYTIGYNNAISNLAGDDFGIVVARFSADNLAVRVFDGTSWSAVNQISNGSAVNTFVSQGYYYGGAGGPYGSTLHVHSLDLSSFGVSQMTAIEIGVGNGSTQLDLIRVGGFEPVPEPGTMAALGLGLAALARRRRK